jgi:kumamolisin
VFVSTVLIEKRNTFEEPYAMTQHAHPTSGHASTSSHVHLPGSERKPRPRFTIERPADPAEVIRIVMKVRPKAFVPDPAVIGAMLPTQRPAPPSREEFAAKYGAEPADIAKVVAFAKAHGFEVVEAVAANRMVVLKGTVKQANAAFGTELHMYRCEESGETYRGRVGELRIPADLQGIVTVVTGLDNRRLAKRRAPAVQEHAEAPTERRIAPTSFFPTQLAQLYNFPSNLDGTGQCIGLLEFGGGFDTGDLATYFAEIPVTEPSVTAISVDGTQNDPNDPSVPIDQRADPEVMLDIEVAGSVAPGANIAVYFAQFTESGWVEAITKAIHDTVNNPSVISVSWGFPEFEDAGTVTFTAQVMDDIDLTLKAAATMGVTVILASGDDGSIDGVLDGAVHVNFPASSPNVLCCGGTRIGVSGTTIQQEVVWSNGIRADGPGKGSTGGGVSEHFPLPAWQTGPGISVPASASTGFVGRGLPDVAAVADPNSGYKIRVFGEDTVSGGTSAATPLWAALIALINQQLATMPGAKAVGYFNPLLYRGIGATSAFDDIIKGTNDAHNNLGGAYTAGPGWDACSGWGTPNGKNLLAALTQTSPLQ